MNIWIVFLLFLVSGCVKIPPRDDQFVSETIEDRINASLDWQNSFPVATLLQQKMSADMAVQIAILNNPHVHVVLEELGISRAELLEATLLPNPFFELEVRYPTQKRLKTNIEYLITSSLIDLFLVKSKTDLAHTAYEQAKLQVAHQILNLAFEVREAYYRVLGETVKLYHLQSLVQMNALFLDLSSQQLSVGNVIDLENQLLKSRQLEIELELKRSKSALIAFQQNFNRLLGLSEQQCLQLPSQINELITENYDLCELENFALENHLELQSAQLEIFRIAQMLGLKEGWTYTNLKLGIAGEREPDGANLIGIGISGELPIFNYGQAARLRLYAQLRQAQQHYEELRIKVFSDVRKAFETQQIYQSMLEKYQKQLLPLQQQIISSSEAQYNVMGMGIDRLLDQKRRQLELLINYNVLLTDYQISKVQLDRAVGWGLSIMPSGETLR